jgi:hypothetical protein
MARSMIPEKIFAAVLVLILIRLLFPELFRPQPASGVVSGGLTYNGTPVPNATVTLYTPDKLTEVAIATSGQDGKYTLPEVAAGNYHETAVLKNADGTWFQADKDITVDAPTITVDLIMERTTTSNREYNGTDQHVATAPTVNCNFRGFIYDGKLISE